MSSSNTFENEILKHLFQNSAILGIGDASGLLAAASAGNLYLRLCTDATVVDDATVGAECAYTGYVAKGVAVARSNAGWTVVANEAANLAEIQFGACSAGSENIRYVELWRNNTGDAEADRISWVQLAADLAISIGITPKFSVGAVVFTFD